MDTPFEKMDADTKEEWRGHPATRAYLDTLSDQLSMLARSLLETSQTSGDLNGKLHIVGGEIRALNFAYDLAARK